MANESITMYIGEPPGFPIKRKFLFFTYDEVSLYEIIDKHKGLYRGNLSLGCEYDTVFLKTPGVIRTPPTAAGFLTSYFTTVCSINAYYSLKQPTAVNNIKNRFDIEYLKHVTSVQYISKTVSKVAPNKKKMMLVMDKLRCVLERI